MLGGNLVAAWLHGKQEGLEEGMAAVAIQYRMGVGSASRTVSPYMWLVVSHLLGCLFLDEHWVGPLEMLDISGVQSQRMLLRKAPSQG
jgi:hypothetical protein